MHNVQSLVNYKTNYEVMPTIKTWVSFYLSASKSIVSIALELENNI